MICYVLDPETSDLICTEEGEPECGEDICHRYGNCLACCGSQPCSADENGQHLWREYAQPSGPERIEKQAEEGDSEVHR